MTSRWAVSGELKRLLLPGDLWTAASRHTTYITHKCFQFPLHKLSTRQNKSRVKETIIFRLPYLTIWWYTMCIPALTGEVKASLSVCGQAVYGCRHAYAWTCPVACSIHVGPFWLGVELHVYYFLLLCGSHPLVTPYCTVWVNPHMLVPVVAQCASPALTGEVKASLRSFKTQSKYHLNVLTSLTVTEPYT